MNLLKPGAALLFFLCLFTNSQAQQYDADTIFFNKYMDTTEVSHADFFRVCIQENGLLKTTDYNITGKIESTGFCKLINPEEKEGYFKFYYRNGKIESEGNFSNNKKNGLWKYYRENGIVWYQENYLDGKLNGQLISYYADNKMKRDEQYKDGERISGQCYSYSGSDTALFPFREIPEFPGGEAAMYKHLAQEIRYPEKAIRHNIQGTVKILFTVDKNGRLTDLKIRKGVYPSLNYEAIRVIENMSGWKPGKIDGEIADVKFIVPIKFVLR